MFKRFLLSYCLLCVAPFLLLGILVANISREAIEKELLNAAEVALDESWRSIATLTEEARQRALSVANSAAVQGRLQALAEEEDPEARQAHFRALNNVLEQFPSSAGYLRVHLVLTSDREGERDLALPMVSVRPSDCQEDWYRKAADAPNGFHWSLWSGSDAALRQSKMIYSARNWTDLVGMVVVDVNPEELRGIAVSQTRSANRLYLVDGDGAIIYPYYNYDKIPEDILTAPAGVYQVGDKQLLVRGMAGTGW